MRVAAMRGDRFVVESRPDPTPGNGEVVVRVKACGICGSDLHYFHHARDIIAMAARLGAPTDEMERNLAEGPVIGHEFVGEIMDFGPQTQRSLSAGDRVCSMPFLLKDGSPVLIGSSAQASGAYAEYMILTESLLVKVDPETPTEAAALTEPVAVAVHAIAKANLGAEDIPVVVGCGPIGLAIIAVLRAKGARKIVASDLSPKRRELAGAMGAEIVIDGRESVIAAAQAAAPGASLVIFENTGAGGMINRLVLEAPQNARILVTGIAAGEESFIPMLAISKELAIQFVIYYSGPEFAEALALIENGSIPWRLLVTGQIGLSDITQAFSELADPERHAKILINPAFP